MPMAFSVFFSAASAHRCRAWIVSLPSVQEKDRFRINLLEVFPVLRDILKSGAYPAGLNNHVTPVSAPVSTPTQLAAHVVTCA